MKNEIVNEIINLGKRLKIEYVNSDINFDLYIQNLMYLLKGEKVSVLFIHKDGYLEKRILTKHELRPLFEMYKRDSLQLAKHIDEFTEISTIKVEKKIFKFHGFEEPYVYSEIIENNKR